VRGKSSFDAYSLPKNHISPNSESMNTDDDFAFDGKNGKGPMTYREEELKEKLNFMMSEYESLATKATTLAHELDTAPYFMYPLCNQDSLKSIQAAIGKKNTEKSNGKYWKSTKGCHGH
jgi:hypothetical protein